VSATDIVVFTQSQVPAYEQIKEQIKALIISGNLVAGDILPSVRGLARDLKVSNITTIRAYADLENEGLVTTVQGRGSFVCDLPAETVRNQYLSDINENLKSVTQKGKAAGLTLKDLQRRLEAIYNESD
jgi:GntR family transcriptional regulator